MDYLEISIDDIKKEVKKLYKKIIKEYNYDLVIFIAKGSYPIGREFADLNKVPLLEIHAKRKGGKIKKIIRPFIKILPKKLLIFLRKKEITSDYHKKNDDRTIFFDIEKYKSYKSKKRILLVDDSIDTGNSIIRCKKAIKDYFINAEVKVAVFNVMNKSSITPDYNIYKNVMICGPWSNDSIYYTSFISEYKKWKENDL